MATCREGERCELSEEVALPVSFVLNQRQRQLLPNVGGKVRAGLRGQTFPSFRRGWSEQQGHYLRTLEPTCTCTHKKVMVWGKTNCGFTNFCSKV